MDIAVVIVHYKDTPILLRAIASILDVYPELQSKIAVVDNSYSFKPDTAEILEKKFPAIRYIASNTNVGYAKAVNWGIENFSSKYVLILNQDIMLQDHAIKKLYEYMESHSDVGIVAPKLVYTDGTVQDSCCQFYRPMDIIYRRTMLGRLPHARRRLRELVMQDFNHASTIDVDWVVGACMFVRREAIAAIGKMDERYFFYFEDVDWCRRMWNNGWRVVYHPEAVFTHNHTRQSAAEFGIMSLRFRLTRIHVKSGLQYFWKYWTGNTALAQDNLHARASAMPLRAKQDSLDKSHAG